MTKIKKYDKKKHFDLIKYKNKLKLEGKNLLDISEENFCELRGYLAVQIEYMEWSSREHYFELIEKFLTEPMDCLTLAKKSRAINNEAERLESEFVLFKPDPKSEGFSRYISRITDVFEAFHVYLGEEDELSEDTVKELVEEIFLEMKNRYPLS